MSSNLTPFASGLGHGDHAASKAVGASSILVVRASLRGEMVYTAASNTAARESLWVRIPPKVPALVVKLGIHDTLKTCCSDERVGSIPTKGTKRGSQVVRQLIANLLSRVRLPSALPIVEGSIPETVPSIQLDAYRADFRVGAYLFAGKGGNKLPGY